MSASKLGEYIQDIDYYRGYLALPAGYRRVIKRNGEVLQAELGSRLHDYLQVKQSLGLVNTPSYLYQIKVDDRIVISNVSLYRQATQYLGLSANATPETKPLLMYYGMHSFMSFFAYSIFCYPGHAPSHGLKITNFPNDPGLTEVTVDSDGVFARLAECYAILGYDSDTYMEASFSPIIWHADTEQFVRNEANSSPVIGGKITLQGLLGMRISIWKNWNHPRWMLDLIDYAVMFICSSLARYRPYNWHRITEGKSYTLINDIDKVYARFPIVKAELENVLLAPLVYESPMQRLKNRTQ